MVNFLVRYASRVVIYDRRAVIRLATDPVRYHFSIDAYFISLSQPHKIFFSVFVKMSLFMQMKKVTISSKENYLHFVNFLLYK